MLCDTAVLQAMHEVVYLARFLKDWVQRNGSLCRKFVRKESSETTGEIFLCDISQFCASFIPHSFPSSSLLCSAF